MKKLVLSGMGATLLLFACSDDPQSGALGKVTLKFEHIWGDQQTSFAMNQLLVHPGNGDSLQLTKLDYYISNIRLLNEDGSEWAEPESYHLIKNGASALQTIEIDNVPEGDYSGVRFLFGVDSTRNVSGAQEGSLAVSHGMFWSWSTGYIFLKAEGLTNQNPINGFSYHVGGFQGEQNCIRPIEFSFGTQRLRVRSEGHCSIHTYVNVAGLWTENTGTADITGIHMPGASAVAMATRFANSFVFDHIHN